YTPRAITSPPAKCTPPSRRRRASSASISSPTVPTSRTAARSARQAIRISRRWTSYRAATCLRTLPLSSARSTSYSGRSTGEIAPIHGLRLVLGLRLGWRGCCGGQDYGAVVGQRWLHRDKRVDEPDRPSARPAKGRQSFPVLRYRAVRRGGDRHQLLQA